MKFFKLVWWQLLSHKIHSVPVKSKHTTVIKLTFHSTWDYKMCTVKKKRAV